MKDFLWRVLRAIFWGIIYLIAQIIIITIISLLVKYFYTPMLILAILLIFIACYVHIKEKDELKKQVKGVK